MSTTEKEINAALDDLEGDQIKNVEQDPPEKKDPPEDQDKNPLGFISYEDWTASGKDPDDWRGKNAYNKEYQNLKENRELKSAMKEVVGSVDDLKQRYQDDANTQIEIAKNEAKANLDQAKKDDDTDAALAAQDKLHSLDKQLGTKEQQKPNPFLIDFAQKNPILDPNSPQYNDEFFQDMAGIHNNKLEQLGGKPTQEQIERVHKWAYIQAKELHTDKFKSHRTTRQTSASSSHKQTNNADSGQLKSIKGNKRNPRDVSPAQDIYNDLIKRGAKEEAAIFKKNVLGDQS